MPPLDERLRLAERTMVALVADAELPPKIGVHPRPGGSFAHAMPAYLRGADPAGADDLVGMKWIAGFPTNRARGPARDPRGSSCSTTRDRRADRDPRRRADHRRADGGRHAACAIRRFAPRCRTARRARLR